VHGTGTNGTGQIHVDACWAVSAGNGSCLDGNTEPEGTDGRGPNGDDFVLEYRFWDNPAALVDFFGVRDGQVIWRTDQERGTLAYRLLGSDDPEGTEWQVASEEIPAQGAPEEYWVPLPTGWDYLKLQEKEDWYAGVRWVDRDVIRARPRTPTTPHDNESAHSRRLQVIALEEDANEARCFLDDMSECGIPGDLEIVLEIGSGVLSEVSSGNARGDTLFLLWPQPEGLAEGSGRGGIECAVGLVGPVEFGSLLGAYATQLAAHDPPGTDYLTTVQLVEAPYDSSAVASILADSLANCDYILLFGQLVGSNESGTTMPCPYLRSPDSPVYNSSCFSLWDWERDAFDTTRVGRCLGYISVEDTTDLRQYLDKMMDYAWNYPWRQDGCRLGVWTYDRDYSGRSGEYVRSQMEAVIDGVDSGWEVDSLWASAFTGSGSGESRADSAVAALVEGRNIVMLMGTLGRHYDLCRWMSTFDALDYYVDIPHDLRDTYTYCHMLDMACDLHDIGQTTSEPSIASELLRVPMGGSVSSIGPCGGFFQDYYHLYLDKFMETYNESGGDLAIGELHRRTRNALLDDYPDQDLMPLFCKTIALLGDPTIKVGGPNSSMYQAVEDLPLGTANRFALEKAFPNPFNPTVAVSFSLPDASQISLRIYNIRGQLVKSLLDGWIDAGAHQVIWDGRNENGETVGSGVYFCQLVSGRHSRTAKLVLLK